MGAFQALIVVEAFGIRQEHVRTALQGAARELGTLVLAGRQTRPGSRPSVRAPPELCRKSSSSLCPVFLCGAVTQHCVAAPGRGPS